MHFSLDLRDFERKARELQGAADQVPFALANAMSTAAFKVREKLITETWPGAVTVRNRNFLRAALRLEKATKRNLQIEIFDHLGRGHLALHAKGGGKQARVRLAIPPRGSVVRTSKGVRANQRPKAIIARTPKRALRITPKGIFVGKGGRLHLKYVFKQSAQIKKDVPFFEDFRRMVSEEIHVAFPITMTRAMRSRR